MAQRLTDKTVATLASPPTGNRIYYDAPDRAGRGWTPGFGCRVTAAGVRAFVLSYRTRAGRDRRMTIGAWPAWSLAAARAEAAVLRRRIDQGDDPLGNLKSARAADSVSSLCDRFIAEYLPKKRPRTRVSYRALIENYIRPDLGAAKVAELAYSDVDRLHRKITAKGSPGAANRCLATLSKMLSLAVRWRMRPDNPCRGVERNQEHKRRRYLSGDELARLTVALARHSDQDAADAIRLLLLTGARRGEVLSMRWADLNLADGVWSKPGATTKQRTDHIVPLSAPVRRLLADRATAGGEFVFPGRFGGHRLQIKTAGRRFASRRGSPSCVSTICGTPTLPCWSTPATVCR